MKIRATWVAMPVCLVTLLLIFPNSQKQQSRLYAVQAQEMPSVEPTGVETAIVTPSVHVDSSPEIDNINVTRAQFDEAKAKWLALGVQEYEIVVENITMYLGGTWDLHVQVRNGNSKIIAAHQIYDNSIEPEPENLTPDDLNYLRVLTVEETYAYVDKVFDGLLSNDLDATWVYQITFDDERGYVSELTAQGFGKDGRHIYDLNFGSEVKSVRIIKSTTPGMPRSGNPGP